MSSMSSRATIFSPDHPEICLFHSWCFFQPFSVAYRPFWRKGGSCSDFASCKGLHNAISVCLAMEVGRFSYCTNVAIDTYISSLKKILTCLAHSRVVGFQTAGHKKDHDTFNIITALGKIWIEWNENLKNISWSEGKFCKTCQTQMPVCVLGCDLSLCMGDKFGKHGSGTIYLHFFLLLAVFNSLTGVFWI